MSGIIDNCNYCGRPHRGYGLYCGDRCATKAAEASLKTCDWCSGKCHRLHYFRDTHEGYPAKFGYFCSAKCIDTAEASGRSFRSWGYWGVEYPASVQVASGIGSFISGIFMLIWWLIKAAFFLAACGCIALVAIAVLSEM